jgi:glutamate-1-semialdehyde 2,1-aminomutase
MAEPRQATWNDDILGVYRERTQGSARLFAEAAEIFPSGITHDSRHTEPYPVYAARAAGARKWDVDGNEYVDYVGGHGALLLGHNDPEVLEATQRQLSLGTHYGASHALEVAWGRLVQRLVPSAERVRFTSSGTEATLLGLRLARAFTGRSKLLRFAGHFHGWHDHMTSGHVSHFDGSPTIGVLPGVAENVIVAPSDDIERTRALLEGSDDIAAAIIEPTGASFGRAPVRPAFLRELRAITARRGVVLIFDEVVTGFRVAPGGAQARFGVTPDLTSLAKILAGGLPGGAIAGRKDLLDALDFEVMRARGREKVRHQGTYNANPLSAAAGVATLERIADGTACERASRYAAELRAALNRLFAEEGVPWAAYGEFSGFHIFLDPKRRGVSPTAFDAFAYPQEELRANDPSLVNLLRLAMLNHGVDLTLWPGGTVSAVHGPDELARTLEAFRSSLRDLRRQRALEG